MKFTAIATVSTVVLAACQPPSPCTLPTPGNQALAASLMTDCLSTQSPTPLAQMPTTGTAVYNGYVTGQFTPSGSPTDTMIGDASMTASFAAAGGNQLTGTISNVSSDNQGAMPGTLTIGNGFIAGNTIVADVSGSLTYGGQAATFSVSVGGGFLGTNASGLALATPSNSPGTVTIGGSSGPASFAIVGRQ